MSVKKIFKKRFTIKMKVWLLNVDINKFSYKLPECINNEIYDVSCDFRKYSSDIDLCNVSQKIIISIL